MNILECIFVQMDNSYFFEAVILFYVHKNLIDKNVNVFLERDDIDDPE